MNKQIVKTIIGEKMQEIESLHLLQRGMEFEDNTSYVLIGIRRAGKSYTLYQDMQKSMNMDLLLLHIEKLKIVM